MVDYSIVQSWEATSVRMCVCASLPVCVCVQGYMDSLSSADPCPAFNSTNPAEEFVRFQLTLAYHPLPLAFVSSASGIQTQPPAAEETHSLIRKCYKLIVSWFTFPR